MISKTSAKFFAALLSEYGTAWPQTSVSQPHAQIIHPQSLDYIFPLHCLSQHTLDVVAEYPASTAGTLDFSVRVDRDPSYNKVLNKTS